MEFDPNYDINANDELGWLHLGLDPNVWVGVALVIAGTSHAAHASTSSAVLDVSEESDDSNDSELEDGFIADVEDPISRNGDEFDHGLIMLISGYWYVVG